MQTEKEKMMKKLKITIEILSKLLREGAIKRKHDLFQYGHFAGGMMISGLN